MLINLKNGSASSINFCKPSAEFAIKIISSDRLGLNYMETVLFDKHIYGSLVSL
jgi:hypothetical protein